MTEHTPKPGQRATMHMPISEPQHEALTGEPDHDLGDRGEPDDQHEPSQADLDSERSLEDRPLRAHRSVLLGPAVVTFIALGAMAFGLNAAEGRHRAWAIASLIIPVTGWVLWALIPWLRWFTTAVTVTYGRITEREGIITRNVRNVPLGRVTDVRLTQSIWQRMMKRGTVVLVTAGQEGPIMLEDMPEPERFYQVVVEAVGASVPEPAPLSHFRAPDQPSAQQGEDDEEFPPLPERKKRFPW